MSDIELNPEQKREALMAEVRGSLSQETESMVDNSVLQAMEKDILSDEQWREFAVQRYLASRGFEKLLEVGVKKASEAGMAGIVMELQNNLNDERGIKSDGTGTQIGSHEVWRRDYYEVLGVTQDMLDSADLLEGSLAYNETLRTLTEEVDVGVLLGALLYQEFSIPKEFEKMKTGRDAHFSDVFAISDEDTSEIKGVKRKRRMYLDHHIAHDAEQHYPKLEKVIQEKILDTDFHKKIKAGIEMMSSAKKLFYASLKERFGYQAE